MMRRQLELGLLLIIGLASVASAHGSARFDGQYVGELTLQRVIHGDCTEPPLGALYPLTVSRGEVRFAYLPHFATTLIGKIDRTGTFKASAPLKHGYVRMTGRIHGGAVTASLRSPSCRYSFHTKD